MRKKRRLRAFAATGALVAALLGTGVAVAPTASAALYTCTKAGNIVYPSYYLRMPVNSGGAGEVDCLLPVGSTGPAVAALQRTLNRCYSAGLEVDGVYGALTKAAVARAQRGAGVTADGVYGPYTAANIRHATWSRDVPDHFLGCRQYSLS
ncbi:peptidoglycan-binding domain-containing protein [Streptomyces sp. NPDC050804]|uniref:peptidoglycan-binding domain-containing protein n=1 Tax=Streptomyces sp. NPDC050804 TaxID=3154745 RepID=UPI003448EF3C